MDEDGFFNVSLTTTLSILSIFLREVDHGL